MLSATLAKNGAVTMLTKFRSARRGRLSAVAAAAFLAAAVSGCASTSVDERGSLAVNDPYEETNRDIHSFNRGLDRYFIRPVSYAYDEVTPAPVRFLVGNALNHLELPRDFVSHLLSGEVTSAGRTFLRFGVNTIAGAGGLLDPATDFELPKEDSDFGVVLASWGFAEGVFIELPFIGPSTTRHTVGRVVDVFLAPTTYIGRPYAGIAVTTLQTVEFRSNNANVIDNVLYESVDSYARSRSVYYQNRRGFIDGDLTLDDIQPLEPEE